MGYQYRINCGECGLKVEYYEGAGETSFVKSYFCKDCSQISEYWEEFDFESSDSSVSLETYDESDMDHDKTSKEELVSCNSCSSKNVIELKFTTKMKCPNCKSSKLKAEILADWD